MNFLRIALPVAGVCVVLGTYSQGFNKRYDAFGQGYAQGSYGIERTGTGYVVLSGSFEPDTVAPDSFLTAYSIILQQIDGQGTMGWQHRYHRPLHFEFLGWADCCDTVFGGGYVVGGGSKNIDGVDEARLVRFNAQGDSLWSRTFGGLGEYWIGQQVKHLADGGFVICGGTDATGDQDGFLIRTDADGSELWRQTYGWEDPVFIDGISAVAEADDGDLYMSGSRFTSYEEGQHWVQRTDPYGVLRWRVDWGGPYKEGATYLGLLSDGFPLVSGGSGYAPEYLSMRPYLAKLDTADGSRLWEREYGTAHQSTAFFAAKECPNTDIIACGVIYEGGHEQGLLLRASSNGDSLWMRNYWYHDSLIDQGEGRFWDVLPTADNGFIMSGFANYPFAGAFPPGYSLDAWVVKVDSLGCIIPGCDGTGVTELITNLGNALTVFPNPAHGEIQVVLELPASLGQGALDLMIVGMDGRVVRRVPWAGNGSNTMRVDVRDLSAGLYTLHITEGTKWITGTKLIIE